MAPTATTPATDGVDGTVSNAPAQLIGSKSIFSLAGKVILVSGAGRGLGLTQAEALLEAGAIVYALDRLKEPCEDFFRVQKRAIAELGTTLQYRNIDVRETDELNRIIEEIATAHGRLDGLIAAAGIQLEKPALEYSAKDANAMFEINITGVFMTAQAAAKQMIRFGKGGSIVMIASMSGTIANRGLLCAPYNASKAGVIQLGRNLASEWGQHGIRVNTISPGYIVTSMVEALFEQYPDRRADWPTQNMLGRLSYAEDYKGAAVFLISDASSFMTGSDLRIDGGHSAWPRSGASRSAATELLWKRALDDDGIATTARCWIAKTFEAGLPHWGIREQDTQLPDRIDTNTHRRRFAASW
ncbi:Triose-phosphate isomerase/Gluconate 5-dehydrogenase, partial [Scytalidium lignicola]